MQRPFPAYQGTDPYIFVSYAHTDAAIVFPELRWIREHGFNVWYDEGISPGSRWTDDLASRIRNASTVLYLVTPRSVASENCRNEIDYALDCGRRLLVVHLRPAELAEGQKLSLGSRQAILKHDLKESDFHAKLLEAITEEIEAGEPISLGRDWPTTRRRLLTGAVVAAAAAAVGYPTFQFLSRGASAISQRTEPLLLLIANFDNKAGDPLFSGTLEEALRIGIEAAPFVTLFPRSEATRMLVQGNAGDTLTEENARLIAVREGLELVLIGSVATDGGGYLLSAQAIDPLSGTVHAAAEADADSKLDVLVAVAMLAEGLRKGLGDLTMEVDYMAETFTASSLEAMSAYVAAQTLAADWKHAGAIPHYERALELDPDFARAYAGWAYSAYELGQVEKSNSLWEKALQLLETLSERERYRTLGLYYATAIGNYPKAIESYQQLVERYPADHAAYNNMAVAHFLNLEFEEAQRVGRQVLEIFPKGLLYLGNYALYSMYAGDFEAASRHADQLLSLDPGYHVAYLPLAMLALISNDHVAAAAAYSRMAETDTGGSLADLGTADMAMARGDFETAIETLRSSIARDEEAGNARDAAIKAVWSAEASLELGRASESRVWLESLDPEAAPSQLVAGVEVYVALNDFEAARRITDSLAGRLQRNARAYGGILAGLIELRRENPVDSVDLIAAALQLADLWLGHFLLGRAYFDAGHYVEAMDEFETCLARRGEGTALFLDDVPTFRRVVQLHYWLGRAQEAVGLDQAAAGHFRAYLDGRDLGATLDSVKDAHARYRRLTRQA